MNYSAHVNTKKQTPQSAPIPGSDQIENSAGGYSFGLDCWGRLNRFLILGNEGGSYYASEKEMTITNCESARECLKKNGRKLVKIVVDISESGRAPKNDPALFVLALAASEGSPEVKALALAALPKVARIGTHLFHFAEYLDTLRGWGRQVRRAFADWYNNKEIDKLAVQIVKYQQRDGWSHRDILRLTHFKPIDTAHNNVYRWVVKQGQLDKEIKLPDFIRAFEQAQRIGVAFDKNETTKANAVKELVRLIKDEKLPREALPTNLSAEPAVWEALIPTIGLEALVRNLGNLSKAGIIENGKFDQVGQVVSRITDKDAILKARLHPLKVLIALKTYANGRGLRGDSVWPVCSDVVEALNKAFYLAFDTIEASDKRTMLALDVSGSMASSMIAGVPNFSAREAAAAMAMVTYKAEPKALTMAFSHQFMPLNLNRTDSLESVLRKTDNLPFAGTDCALPMLYATEKGLKIDTFIIYTDSETWAGAIHPSQALQAYRRKTGINAKLIVVGMTANKFTIADPNDAGMLDVVGFDTATPEVIRAFSASEV